MLPSHRSSKSSVQLKINVLDPRHGDAATIADIYDANETQVCEIAKRKKEMCLPAVELHIENVKATARGYGCL